ncbi:hypothetical protein [Paenibacillus harenae]|uniref:hypothetical protein n=1 Tax=Paenibacillus harenae TaxID=306543 RepID=UPI0027916791|nr:hypothetical protein [Paenibacillus harenae]MDQ0060771.1 hypothetical protein [Paenibacillus harenae]
MTLLTIAEEHREAAVRFMKEEARPLERALYAHEFEGGSKDAVLEELAKFQNTDGGFGHGLEPDSRCKASSALATTVALQYLIYIEAGHAEPVVREAIRFLIETYNTAQPGGWDIVPREVESAPRAPWWNYNEQHDGWGNPAIEIVGYFHAFSELVPAALLDELTEHAITHINVKSTKKDFHELLCCLRFAELVPASELSAVKSAIDEMVAGCVSVQPEQWEGYCLTPVQVADSPSSMYYEQLKDSVRLYLPYMLTKQQEDGAWWPTWTWGQYEDTWPEAKQDWKGFITFDALRMLKAYGIVTG